MLSNTMSQHVLHMKVKHTSKDKYVEAGTLHTVSNLFIKIIEERHFLFPCNDSTRQHRAEDAVMEETRTQPN